MSREIYTRDYLNNITKSKFFYSDRDINDKTTLPYTFYDIKIKPNDLVVAHTINGALEKLHDNLLYIISQSRVPRAILPNYSNYTTFLATTATGTEGLTGINTYSNTLLPSISANTTATELTGIATGEFFNHLSSPGTNNGIIFLDDGTYNTIAMVRDDITSASVSSVTNKLDNYTTRTVLSANKIVVDDDILFVLNTNNKLLYKYDITGIARSDSAYFDPATETHGKLLIDLIGGNGKIGDKVRFYSPVTISRDDSSNLYIIDTDGSTVMSKKLDKNCNFNALYNISTPLSGQTPKDMIYIGSRFYLLTNTSVHEFSTSFVHLKEWKLGDTLSTGENYQQLVHSKENDSVVYVVTNKNIFKKFVTKLDNGIGKFILTGRGLNIGGDNNISFVSAVSSTVGEYIYVCDSAYGVIYRFNEFSDYQETMNTSFQNSFLTLDDIKIKKDEYVSDIVYNKTMSKMFYNHAIVGNSITSKLIGEVSNSDVYTFKTARYVLPDEVHSRNIAPDLDNFVGINEIVLNTTINRTLRKIYDLQLKILKDIEIERFNTIPPTKITSPTSATSATSWTWIGTKWMSTVEAAKDPDLSKYITQTTAVISPTWQTYSTPVTTYNIGDTVAFTITASSDSDVTYSTTSSTLTGDPATGAGLALDPATGSITGALTSSEFEFDVSYDYTIRATDEEGQYTDATFRLDVSKPTTEASWPYNSSYTFTWDTNTSQTLGWTSTSYDVSQAISGVYTNETASLSASGTLFNEQPIFTNASAASGATLYYTGNTWAIDIFDDENIESVVTLRLTGSSTTTPVPTGNYYASQISNDRVGYIS